MHSLFGLTPQEARVAGLLANGLNAANIASMHSVSVNTVRTQRASIYSKIGIRNQTELTRVISALPPNA